MKILISISLLLFVLFSLKYIRFLKKKYMSTLEEKYITRVLHMIILLYVVPISLTYKILPESLNHPINGIITILVLVFAWLVYPNIEDRK